MCVLNVDPTHVVSERLGVSVIATSSLILSSLLKFVCKPLYQQLSLPVFILFVIALLFLLCIFKVGNLNSDDSSYRLHGYFPYVDMESIS